MVIVVGLDKRLCKYTPYILIMLISGAIVFE